MATKSIAWKTGGGTIELTYTGSGNGTIVVTSSPNSLDVERSQTVTVATSAGGSVVRSITVKQAAGPNFRLADNKVLRLSDGVYFNVKR